ncbi:MAG: DUF503 domain-containing protein [Chloroflexi bacterium]|nr:DUF503 domain-containing protein [Chloroflexota bacterium]
MTVGVCKVKVRLPENMTLKGKRQVLKSIIAQIRNKFNVSVAEVDDQDLWQLATIGLSVVSNEGRFVDEVLNKVVDFICRGRFDIEVLDHEIEIIPV